jgi:hypothetical protein
MAWRTDKRKRPYWRDSALLGKTFLDRQAQPILRIGKDAWSRQEIVDDLHCGNFVAAQNLTRVADELDAKSLDDLAARYTLEDLFQINRCGITTVFVFLSALDSRGKKDPMEWIDHEPADVVTLSTERLRARKRKAQARKEARAAARKQAATSRLEQSA